MRILLVLGLGASQNIPPSVPCFPASIRGTSSLLRPNAQRDELGQRGDRIDLGDREAAAPEGCEVSRRNSGHLPKPPLGKFTDGYENGKMDFYGCKFMVVPSSM